jgi:hypothetical protein
MHKGFKCLYIASGRIYISRDVIFDESVFPFSSMHSSAAATTPMSDSLGNNAAANPSNTPAMTLFHVLDLDVQVLVPQGMPQAPVLLPARPSNVPPTEVHAPEPLQVAHRCNTPITK